MNKLHFNPDFSRLLFLTAAELLTRLRYGQAGFATDTNQYVIRDLLGVFHYLGAGGGGFTHTSAMPDVAGTNTDHDPRYWDKPSDIDLATTKVLKVDGTQVVTEQQAYVGNAPTDASESNTITDPADSPATADALRDDLVANAIPDMRRDLDALGGKINDVAEILNLLVAALEAHGLISDSAAWVLTDARSMVTFGFVNPLADTYAAGLTTHGMWDTA